ncbi:MAG: bactofilin family protein [Rhodovulum sp.]
MFSKSRINEPGPKAGEPEKGKATEAGIPRPGGDNPIPSAPKAKPPASMLSSDLVVTGNLKTTGDIQVEGTIDGDIQAHLLTVGENATVRGEVIADDVVINGRVIGKVRGLKVRLTSTARVEGDIIHKTIAIESGAHFEGSVQRQDDPLNTGKRGSAAAGGKPPHVLGEGNPGQKPAENTTTKN